MLDVFLEIGSFVLFWLVVAFLGLIEYFIQQNKKKRSKARQKQIQARRIEKQKLIDEYADFVNLAKC